MWINADNGCVEIPTVNRIVEDGERLHSISTVDIIALSALSISDIQIVKLSNCQTGFSD